jgi:DNA-binding transcriptional LysR family regulator
MRIRNLLTFIKVAQLQSFHAAAQQLHASQPAISARIVALEETMGVKLFARDKGGTRLTARGQQLLPYAEKLVAVYNEMKTQIHDDSPEKGLVRIGVTDTLAHLWLTRLLQDWRETFPLIEFEFVVDVSSVLWKQLQEHQLDLGFLVSGQGVAQCVTEPLSSYPQVWVGSPSLGLSEQVLELKHLVDYPLLSFPRGTQPWLHLQTALEPLGESRPMLHTCSSVASLLELAEQGLGLALLPEPLVAEHLSNRRLDRLNIDIQVPNLDFCCTWRVDDDRILPRLLADSARLLVQKSIA